MRRPLTVLLLLVSAIVAVIGASASARADGPAWKDAYARVGISLSARRVRRPGASFVA